MDPRTAAHALNEIASLLELRGENRFKSRAYRAAARSIVDLETDDIAPMVRSGEIAELSGVGPAVLGVLGEMVAEGDSPYLDRLREETPEGLLELLRVPGLGTAKIHAIHQALGIESLYELEEAARDGRLTKVKGFGPKTAAKLLNGIAFLRETGAFVLYHHAAAEGARLLAAVRRHPDVVRAELAGGLRRHREVIRDIDIVAECSSSPARVAASFAHAPGVKDATRTSGHTVAVRFVDGTLLDLVCVERREWAVALWRATGSADHVAEVEAFAHARGFRLDVLALRDETGREIPLDDEHALYRALDLAYVPPELREGRGEVDAARDFRVPSLVEPGDIRGVLHCHSEYSDGGATIAEMAGAARAHGWSYLGVTDHSQSAFYAGGLSHDDVLRQHDEIDALNATLDGFRVLKGIEADILPCGRVDYDESLLDRFDFVIASIHSRFGMTEAQMTERVAKALDDPHVTVLGHPTGRLLLTREPYAIDMTAIIDKAAEVGAAIELNADPHRLDLDWRLCMHAKARGVPVEIGPDAHSTGALDNVAIGVGIARKGWLERGDVLNARSADDVLRFARRRRERRAIPEVRRGA